MYLDKDFAGIAVNALELSPRDRKRVDQAYWFIEKTKDATEESLRVDLLKVRRRVDWRILPVMLLCYTAVFIDKTILNVRRQ